MIPGTRPRGWIVAGSIDGQRTVLRDEQGCPFCFHSEATARIAADLATTEAQQLAPERRPAFWTEPARGL